MPDFHHLSVNFNSGELSPLMIGRVDFDGYRSGCVTMDNFIVRPYGGAFKAPGTQYIGEVKDSTKKTRLVSLRISQTENYIFEVGAGYFRFWKENDPAFLQIKSGYSVPSHSTSTTYYLGDLVSSSGTNYVRIANDNAKDASFASALAAGHWYALTGNVIEWPNNYSVSELSAIQFQQVGRLVILVHPLHQPLLIESIPVDTLTGNFIRNTAWSDAATTAVSYSFLVQPISYIFPPLKKHDLSRENDTVTISYNHSNWATSTSYSVGNIRIQNSIAYYCLIAHTSGTFNTDLAANRWRLAVGAEVEYNLTASNSLIFTGLDAGDQFIVEPSLYRYSSGSQPRGASLNLWTGGTPGSEYTPSQAIFIQGGFSVSSSWKSGESPLGALRLEQSNNGVDWEVAREWTLGDVAQGTILFEDEAAPAGEWYRLGGFCQALSSSPAGMLLEAADAQIKIPFTVLAVTSSTVLKVRAALPFGSVVPTPAISIASTAFYTSAFSEDNGYPAAVAVHNLRLWFGGTAKEPNRIRGSVVDDFFNFRTGEGDGDGFDLVLNSNEANVVRWIASFRQGLVVGTAGDEWTISGGGDGSEVLKPSNVQAVRRNRAGSSTVQSVQTKDSLLWVSPTGRKIFEFAYLFSNDAYEANDMTLRSESITKSGIVETAYQSEPDPVLWCVTSDGRLLGFSYNRANQITAWFNRRTDGAFESVATFRGNGEADRVWMIVNRTINGTTKRYIERFYPKAQAFDFDTSTDFCYLDCAKKITQSSSTAVTGLSHLEGKAVKVWANGTTIESKTVASGAITLGAAATSLFVGLPYTATLQPMPIELILRDGTAQGRRFNAQRIHLLLQSSMGGTLNNTPDETGFAIGYPSGTTGIFTGRIDEHVPPEWRDSIALTFKHSDPTPFNLLGFVLKAEISGS